MAGIALKLHKRGVAHVGGGDRERRQQRHSRGRDHCEGAEAARACPTRARASHEGDIGGTGAELRKMRRD